MNEEPEVKMWSIGYEPNPKTGKEELVGRPKMGQPSQNPYYPWANAEAMEMAKKAGWPDDPDFMQNLRELYKKQEQSPDTP